MNQQSHETFSISQVSERTGVTETVSGTGTRKDFSQRYNRSLWEAASIANSLRKTFR